MVNVALRLKSVPTPNVKHDICFELIRNAVTFYLPFMDDSIEAVVVEFMQWRLYWLRHKGDSLPYHALGALLSAKELNTYSSPEFLL